MNRLFNTQAKPVYSANTHIGIEFLCKIYCIPITILCLISMVATILGSEFKIAIQLVGPELF